MQCNAMCCVSCDVTFPAQTYEGGLGGEPGNEAHGGYTYCGLAALILAGRPDVLDVPRLLHWAAQRQGWVEGGFNGRTNKLTDGCYSFWQGRLFPLLHMLGNEYTRQVKVGSHLQNGRLVCTTCAQQYKSTSLAA